MKTYKKPNKVSLVYFTGTGSTKLAAEQFAEALRSRDIEVSEFELHCQNQYIPRKTDLLVLLYPVYAANAPRPVHDFIKTLPYEYRCKTAVISVAGGGDVTPNKACRKNSIHLLHEQGYPVVYEHMLVMPSNIFIETPEELSIRLLEVLPAKVNRIVEDFCSGIIRRTKPDILNQILSDLLLIEHVGSKHIGKLIHIEHTCNGCGLCSSGCPTGNIQIKDGRPLFDTKCALCLKCIYRCPRKALELKFLKFIVLKAGYPLKEWKSKMSSEKHSSIEELTKGPIFSGLKKYFYEK